MLVETPRAAMVMVFAGREVSDQTAKSIQQSLSEFVRAEVKRQPIEDLLVERSGLRTGLRHCHDTLIQGWMYHPQEPPPRATPEGGSSMEWSKASRRDAFDR